MIDLDFERLRSIGLTPALAQGLAQLLSSHDDDDDNDLTPARQPARVAEVHRETLVLHDGHATRVARPHPQLVRDLSRQDQVLAVGDWVLAHPDGHGGRLWVRQRVPPASQLVRRDGEGRRHAIVCNVDTALVVMGLDLDFNLRRLERYLALVHEGGVLPVVVLTKCDLAGPAGTRAALDKLHGRLPGRVEVHAVDATATAAAQALAPCLLAGRTLVVLGSSGAGKSTLTNTLLGHEVQDTGAVRSHDSRGKHTTTARSLHRLPGGACVIDTPGLRTLRPDGDEHSVAASFDDIAQLAARCRFRNCRHEDEPGCAVRAGVPPDRLVNYHKLLREMRRDQQTVLQRQEQLRRWKSLDRGVAARHRMKHGE